MKTVLVLTSEYLNTPAANGICAAHLVRELEAAGHRVLVVCYGDPQEQSDTVRTVTPPKKAPRRGWLLRYARRALEMAHTAFRPKVRGALARGYRKQALAFCEKESVDAVVGTYFPLETATAMKALKKRHPHLSCALYELDSAGDGIGEGGGFDRLRIRAYNRYLDTIYGSLDRIAVMRSHEEYWKTVFGKKHGSKLVLCDIPVLVQKDLPAVEKEENAPVSFLYGGLLEKEYRSPEHLLAVFDGFCKQMPATLDFFSKGDCETMIAEAAGDKRAIRQNGYVAPAVLDEAVAKADVLVSIGNRVSRSVPSKVISYLAYGKPVVHISSQKEDVCAFYLERYPLGLVLKEWDGVEENAAKLFDFVSKVRGQRVDLAAVEEALPMNTPRYSVQRIV